MKNEKSTKEFLLNILINIIIPILILFRLSNFFGPINTFLIALAFPFFYGIYDFIKDRKVNFYSLIGIVGILVTVGIGFFRLDPELIAVKEGLIPFTIGLGILVLERTSEFMRKMFDKLLDIGKISKSVGKKKLDKIMRKSLYIFISGFFAAAIINYLLAKIIVVSPPGTVTFNEEYALLTLLNFPGIIIPVFAGLFLSIYYFSVNVEKHTGKKIDEFYR